MATSVQRKCITCAFKQCLHQHLGVAGHMGALSGQPSRVANTGTTSKSEVETDNSQRNGKQKPQAQGRVEVRATIPSAKTGRKEKGNAKDKKIDFLISWSKNGDAVFHSECWEQVLAIARKRGPGSGISKKSGVVGEVLSSSERAMIKEAAGTAEYHDPPETVEKEAGRIAEMIKCAKHCVVFTGAGISTSAGIGDYRGKGGKWTEEDRQQKMMNEQDEDYLPLVKKVKEEESQETDSSDDDSCGEGVPYEDLRPTYTHEAITKLIEMKHVQYVISQNGDGLHLLSGVPQEKISELHGNVFLEKCEKCEERYERSYYVMDDVSSQYFEDLEDYGKTDLKKPKHAKKCVLCGLNHRTGRKCDKKTCRSHLIDTIINFRDNLEEDILDRATEHAKLCDLMICLGSTLTVTPASNLVKKGKKPLRVVICNRQETDMDAVCLKKSMHDKMPLGSRVFGDCDILVSEIMKNLLPEDELDSWEKGRAERLGDYDLKRS